MRKNPFAVHFYREFNKDEFQTLELTMGYFMGHRFYINDTQIEIYPTILFAIPNSSIDQLYADTESMLGDLKRGGTADEQEDPEEN